jgi:hypothetical protein
MTADILEISFHAEGPQPLLAETPDGKPYPVDALGNLAKMAKAIQGKTRAPVEIGAQSILAAVSLAVQGFADVETLGGERPVSLYCLTIAQSGERKSSCDAIAMKAIRNFEQAKEKQYHREKRKFKDQNNDWSEQRDALIKKLKDGGNEWVQTELDVHDDKQPVSPIAPQRTVSEPTFEGLTKLFSQGHPSLGVFSDEGGQFMGGHAMNKDNRQKTLAAFNDLWQGNPIRRTRQGEQSIALFGRRLAIHLMVQPAVAQNFMADPLAVDIGFLPRFLICQPISTIGTRLHETIWHDDATISAFHKKMRRILEKELAMDKITRALTPRTLKLSPEAENLLIAFSDEIEIAQQPGREMADISGYASKSAEQAARIAGVLTLWDDLLAKDVTAETMRNAIELARFYLSEALRLMGTAASPEMLQIDALRKWLLEKWPHPEIVPSEIMQRSPTRAFRNSDKATEAIAVLVKHGWLVELPLESIVRGINRKKAYRIVNHPNAKKGKEYHGQENSTEKSASTGSNAVCF